MDGVSWCPHGLPDVASLGADVYLFSLYKVYGPHQGVMVMRRAVNEMLPSQAHFFNAAKAGYRFTPAGPDHAQVAAVNGVLDYLEAVHAHHVGNGASVSERAASVCDLFRAAECETVQPLLDFLGGRPGVRLIGRGRADQRAPTVSFSVKGTSPQGIAARLAERNIGIGSGHCYAYRLIEALGLPAEEGVARLSLVHYTAPGEVGRLIGALEKIL